MNKYFRISVLLLMIIMLSFSISSALMADVPDMTISLSDAEGYPGDTVSVTIDLKDNPGIISVGLELNYDSDKLELVRVENKGLLKDATFSKNYSDVPYILTWNDALSGNMEEDGTLATLTFRIKPDCSPCKIDLSLSAEKGNIHNYNLKDVPFRLENGTITVLDRHVHRWGAVEYKWSDDHSSCTAMRSCTDPSCDEMESETAKSEISVDENGNSVYRVVFESDDFDDQKIVIKEEKIRVKFQLIGASLSSQGIDYAEEPGNSYGSSYETWIPNEEHRVKSGSSAYDLFDMVLKEAGLDYNASGYYIRSITAPALLGGYVLSEFSNGLYSGWMYTVNNSHPKVSVGEYILQDGDELIVHYINDYRFEENAFPWLNPADPDDPVEPIFFVDVDEDDWFYDYVQYVAQKGLMQGIGNNKFDPAGYTTRGQLVTILYRLEGEPSVSGMTNPFVDLKQNWYVDAVIWAANNGIVKGISATNYAPDDVITREQAATILYRYAGYKNYDISGSGTFAPFPDAADVSKYAETAMSWAISEGLISGSAENGQIFLKPQGNTTRAQLAALLQRFCENIVK